MQGQINIKQLLKRCAFLAFAGSLTACFDEQIQTSEAGQNTARSGSILFTQIRDQKMRIKLGSFIFSLPYNLRDTRCYTSMSAQPKQA